MYYLSKTLACHCFIKPTSFSSRSIKIQFKIYFVIASDASPPEADKEKPKNVAGSNFRLLSPPDKKRPQRLSTADVNPARIQIGWKTSTPPFELGTEITVVVFGKSSCLRSRGSTNAMCSLPSTGVARLHSMIACQGSPRRSLMTKTIAITTTSFPL